jgi:hypothetical protein
MRPHLSAKIDGVLRPDLAISRYSSPMKTPPATPEFANFTNAMRDILKVSKDEMHTRIEAHKESGKRLSKGSASLGSAAASKIRSAVSAR